jgi:hypothetical protein
VLPRFLFALAVCAAGWGADKKLVEGKASNDAVEITASAYTDKQAIKQLLGSELDDGMVVIQVQLAPKAGAKVKVFRDDFVLHSNKDGQRCGPMAPSQVAGSGALVISSTGSGSGMATQNKGPIWGPPAGGRPRQMGGDGAALGNQGDATQATASPAGRSKENPLLDVLKERVLPEKEITERLSGLLYFFLEGKHKPKDVELLYRGSATQLVLRFKD